MAGLNKIKFINTSTNAEGLLNLDGLVDAFAGAPLDRNQVIYQCEGCRVFYHKESVDALNEFNDGNCVSCNYGKIVKL